MSLAVAGRVSKRYGRLTAIDDATLELDRGEIVGLLGPNGAGKTTLLRMIAGLVRPTTGRVHLRGAAAHGAIQYFGGERTLPPFVSAKQWITACAAAGSGSTPRRRIGVLSRGTRQRLGLEIVLAAWCPLLLLDEPWEHLDPDAGEWLSRALLDRREAGAAILIASHRIHDLAEVCDRCLFLERGRLLSALSCADITGPADRARWMLDRYKEARSQL
jgi:ABC-type multidrug transport system ATPase subunit